MFTLYIQFAFQVDFWKCDLALTLIQSKLLQDTYHQLVEALIASQADESSRTRLTEAFTQARIWSVLTIFGKRFKCFPFSVDGKHTTLSRAHPQNQVQGQLWQVHRQRARLPFRQIGEDQALVLCKKNSRDASLFCFEAHSAKHLRNCMIQCDTSCIYLHTQTCRNIFWNEFCRTSDGRCCWGGRSDPGVAGGEILPTSQYQASSSQGGASFAVSTAVAWALKRGGCLGSILPSSIQVSRCPHLNIFSL